MARGLGYFGSDKQEQSIAIIETEIFRLKQRQDSILSDVLIVEVAFEHNLED
jgi:hypothetical protein